MQSHSDFRTHPPVANCSNFDVKLEQEGSPNRGKLLVCFNGVWGVVCNNGIRNEAAEIVCHQLGFQRKG